jgi:hypothetical protein
VVDAFGVAWSSSIGSDVSSCTSRVRTDAADRLPSEARSASSCDWDVREEGGASSSSMFDATEEGRLSRERVEAEEPGRVGIRPVLIADVLGRPPDFV